MFARVGPEISSSRPDDGGGMLMNLDLVTSHFRNYFIILGIRNFIHPDFR